MLHSLALYRLLNSYTVNVKENKKINILLNNILLNNYYSE